MLWNALTPLCGPQTAVSDVTEAKARKNLLRSHSIHIVPHSPMCGHNCSNILPRMRSMTRKCSPASSPREMLRLTTGMLTTTEWSVRCTSTRSTDPYRTPPMQRSQTTLTGGQPSVDHSGVNPRPNLTFSPTKRVLVHQDPAPWNMMFDTTGNLWIIDWNYSGYYSAFVEYMGIDAVSAGSDWFRAPTWASWWGRVR